MCACVYLGVWGAVFVIAFKFKGHNLSSHLGKCLYDAIYMYIYDMFFVLNNLLVAVLCYH